MLPTNQLLADPKAVNPVYWTLTREPKARKTPYQFHQAAPVNYQVGGWPYQRTAQRDFMEFQPFGEALSEAGARERLEHWNLRPLPVNNGHPEAWETLVKEAERRGLPREYKRDLYVHDRTELTSPAWTSDHFIWVLRDHGTHIIKLDAAHASKSNPVELVRAVGNFSREECYWYLYQHGRLTELTRGFDQALSLASEARDNATSASRRKGI